MNRDKLIEVLSIQAATYDQFRMFAYLIRLARKMGVAYYVDSGNIYITKGEADNYPCIVAHMDTVHDIVEDLTVIDIAGNLTGFNRLKMEQTGIGGDDKVGIFIALQCLEKFDNIKVAFFRDEETGCEGSYFADTRFFKDCSFVLQCDRRGNNDFITNAAGVELSSRDFQRDITNILLDHGYGLNYGSITDVMALKELGVKCSMANMSCGYYNPHCSNEYVNVEDVANCLAMVEAIIDRIGHKYYPFKYKKRKSNWYFPKSKKKYPALVDSIEPLYTKGEFDGEDLAIDLPALYCNDCWSNPAGDNGLCHACNDYYEKELGQTVQKY